MVVGAAFPAYHPASYRTMCASKEASVSCLEMVRGEANWTKTQVGKLFLDKADFTGQIADNLAKTKTHCRQNDEGRKKDPNSGP